MGGNYIIKVALFFRFGHQGANLFSKATIFWLFRPLKSHKTAKIRPDILVKHLSFQSNKGVRKYISTQKNENRSGNINVLYFFMYSFIKKVEMFRVSICVKGSGAQAQIPARAVSRLSAQSSNKRVPIT